MPGEPLRVCDIARYLDRLAWLYQDDNTGNAEMGDELRRLGDMLRPHGNLTVSELTITAGGDAKLPAKRSAPMRNGKASDAKGEVADISQSPVPSDLRSLSGEEVERFLEDNTLTKERLAELGHERFSIAKSDILRLSKPRARKRILRALKTERSMRIIAEQARKAGRMRSA